LIVLATEWDEYCSIDPVSFRSIVRAPRLLDTRNAVDREYWCSAGWHVFALGRGGLLPASGSEHVGDSATRVVMNPVLERTPPLGG
jgi:UDPglucose 6-dehydrogenase